ncbi:MAG: hypothetical protein HY696_07440 [Deltaproteobacteria bacterium]|nr:hypothetical protein [Deltaproteobacteria bacterium]
MSTMAVAMTAAKQLGEWATGLFLFGSEPLQFEPERVATKTYDHLDFNCDGVWDRVIVEEFANCEVRTSIEIADPTAPAKALVRKAVDGVPARVVFQDELGDALVGWHRTQADTGVQIGDWVPLAGAPWFARSVEVYADALETTAPGCYPESSIYFSLQDAMLSPYDIRIVAQREIAAMVPQEDFNASVVRLVACSRPNASIWSCFSVKQHASPEAVAVANSADILMAREQPSLNTLRDYWQAPRHDRATIAQALDNTVRSGVNLWWEGWDGLGPTPLGSAIYSVLGAYYGLDRQTIERIRLELSRSPGLPPRS